MKVLEVLKGLDFERKGNGSVVLDRRKGHQERYIGIIMKRPLGIGFMLCPFLKNGLEFTIPVPRYFGSIPKAEKWIRNHAILYNPKRKYTLLNGLIYHLLPENPLERRVTLLHGQISVLIIMLSVIISFFIPPKTMTMAVALKGIGILLCIAGIGNLLLLFRERL